MNEHEHDKLLEQLAITCSLVLRLAFWSSWRKNMSPSC